MSKKIWDVEPRPDGKWAVQREGTDRADSIHERKADAIERGRELAKAAPDGQLRIKTEDGKWQTEYTYGHDPKDRKG